MANTGTGSTQVKFPSYYNPAALSWVRSGHFSFSGTALNSVSSKGQGFDFSSQKISTTNLFTVLTPALGNVALYLYIPNDYEFQVDLKDQLHLLANSSGIARVSYHSQTVVAGLSFAPRNSREDDWWSFGFNAQIEYQDQSSDSIFYKKNDANDGGSLSVATSRKNQIAATASFGNIYAITPNVNIGYMFTLPSFKLSQRNDSTVRLISYNYEAPGAFLSSDAISPGADIELFPLRTRFGMSFIGKILHWRFDIEHQEATSLNKKQVNLCSGFEINITDTKNILVGLRRSIEKNFGVSDSIDSTLLTLGFEAKSKEFTTSFGGYSVAADPSSTDSKTSIYGLVINTFYQF